MSSRQPKADPSVDKGGLPHRGRKNSAAMGEVKVESQGFAAPTLKPKPDSAGLQKKDDPRLRAEGEPLNTKEYVGPPAKPEHFDHRAPQKDKLEKAVATPQTSLSPLLIDFLKIPLGDYKECERFCKNKPGIWAEDVDEFRKFTITYLGQGKNENARRCAERWFMVMNARQRKFTVDQANAYVKSLSKNDDTFQAQISDVLNKLAPDVSEATDAGDTIDDNITLDNEAAQITGSKMQSGPNLELIDADYEHKDLLRSSFKLRLGRDAVEFFVKGRVFAMVWHENAGSPTNPKPTETSRSLDQPFHRHTINKDGIVIFSHIRNFVIIKVKAKRRYCLALPINTYGGHGLTEKRMHMEEKQAHAIIYASDKQPLRMEGEVKLNKSPIAVEMAQGQKLKAASRVHFGKMHSIEWNVKVKDVGVITDKVHRARLTNYFKQEFRKGDDTETETEAGPSRSSKVPSQR